MPADGCDGAKALSFYSGLTVLIVFFADNDKACTTCW